SAKSWVLTLAHRRAVDRVRSEEAATRREERATASAGGRPYDEVEEEATARLEGERVRRCLDALTELQRQTVKLAYYGGYTYREVAKLLSAPLGTVKTRMRDGLIRLRDCLGVERWSGGCGRTGTRRPAPTPSTPCPPLGSSGSTATWPPGGPAPRRSGGWPRRRRCSARRPPGPRRSGCAAGSWRRPAAPGSRAQPRRARRRRGRAGGRGAAGWCWPPAWWWSWCWPAPRSSSSGGSPSWSGPSGRWPRC